MRKIAVMLVLSLLFVSELQGVSSAYGETTNAIIEIFKPTPDGNYERTTIVEPSRVEAVKGAVAGAA